MGNGNLRPKAAQTPRGRRRGKVVIVTVTADHLYLHPLWNAAQITLPAPQQHQHLVAMALQDTAVLAYHLPAAAAGVAQHAVYDAHAMG